MAVASSATPVMVVEDPFAQDTLETSPPGRRTGGEGDHGKQATGDRMAGPQESLKPREKALLLGWLNETLGTSYTEPRQLDDGVTYALLVDILLPGPFPLHLLRLNAVKAQDKKENFCILFRFLEKTHGILVDFDAATLTEGSKKNAMHLALLSVLHTSITSRKKQLSLAGTKVLSPPHKYECKTVSSLVASSSCSSLARSGVPADGPASSVKCELASNSLPSASRDSHRKEEESGTCEGVATAAVGERRPGEGSVEFLPTREGTPSHGRLRGRGSSPGSSDGEVEASRGQEGSQEGAPYNLPVSSTKTAEKGARSERDASPSMARCGVPIERDERGHGPSSSLGRAQPVTVTPKQPATSHCYARDSAQFASQSPPAIRHSQDDEDIRSQEDRSGLEPRRGSPQNNNRSARCSFSSSPSVRVSGETKSAKHRDPSQEGPGASAPSEDSREVTVSSANPEATQRMLRRAEEAAPHCIRATLQARDEKCEDSTAHRSRKQASYDSRTEAGEPGNGIVPDHQGSYLAFEGDGKTTPTVGSGRRASTELKEQRPECSHATPRGIRGGDTTLLAEEQKSERSSQREEDENDRQRLLAELREEEALEDPDGLQAKKRLAIAECREAILEMQRQIQQRLERYDAFLGHTTQILGERNFYFDKLSCIQRVILDGSYAKTSVGQAVLSIITSKPADF